MTTASCLLVAAALNVMVVQSEAQSSAALQKLADYVAREWPGESHQQAITTTALTLLADAVEARAAEPAARGADLAPDIERLRRQIDEYRSGKPGDLRQSRLLRRTLLDASSVIERLLTRLDARRQPRDARLNALERAAKSLSENAPVIRQPDVLEHFFRHAVEALRRLDRP